MTKPGRQYSDGRQDVRPAHKARQRFPVKFSPWLQQAGASGVKLCIRFDNISTATPSSLSTWLPQVSA